jgi:hypothetical protein
MGVPTFRYHPEHGADIFDSDLIPALEKQGWKDTPAGMNVKPYNKAGCYTEGLRRAGKSIKDVLGAIPPQFTLIAGAKALLDKGGLNQSSWMRAKGLDAHNNGLRSEWKGRYEAILKHLEGKIVKDKHNWGWK